jgi:hypothetical protein
VPQRPQRDDGVTHEIVIGQEIMRKRREFLAQRRENQRLVIDTLPEPEAGQYDLGDLS